ncbi:ABC transporter permease [Aestuariicoccus sp. MJ-SS9]|uniref:ABC transporter permease n=1 Tax=Aestuariicoccus sp. MJ-SS9 TaxID=3079855 RepID=UPI00290EC753|nr:ABC transporter permease [Aestuariicoccus sp. MJ-SS9]MDU8913408.1 ABC transporter permease [Aestuariicoccus sp. MJ-SS9]
MLRYIAWRLITAIPIVIIGTAFVFMMIHIAPGDPAALMAGDNATPEQLASIRRQMNLDAPLWERFAIWFGDLLRLDLGQSIFSGQDVTTLIGQRLEVTLMLTATALVATVIIAVPTGVLAGWLMGRPFDRAISLLSGLAFSIPPFLIGYIVVYFLALKLRWIPVQGYTPVSEGLLASLHSLVGPSLTLAVIFWALVSRVTRAAIIEILQEDYIRTARAKGLGELVVVGKHALINAGIPITTVIGLGVAVTISGVVVTESVFNLPGLGRLTVDAVLQRDFPVVQGVMIFFIALLVVVNLVVDLSYVLFDPRLRK